MYWTNFGDLDISCGENIQFLSEKESDFCLKNKKSSVQGPNFRKNNLRTVIFVFVVFNVFDAGYNPTFNLNKNQI